MNKGVKIMDGKNFTFTGVGYNPPRPPGLTSYEYHVLGLREEGSSDNVVRSQQELEGGGSEVEPPAFGMQAVEA